MEISVQEQVNRLIEQATLSDNLCKLGHEHKGTMESVACMIEREKSFRPVLHRMVPILVT